MASVVDRKMLDEIPSNMQKLARLVVRGFYGTEHGILVDLLIRNVCMLEEELRNLLRFDSKQLRTVLMTLKNDKIVKERQLVEQRESRPVKHNYYFVNYRALINVLKYKLDHMRKKLETEEKTETHRAGYKCTRCHKTYTDLEINLLWNGEEMQCTYCSGMVDEDADAGPNQTTGTSLARYNEQMEPYFQLLQELDGFQLAPHLLEPMPRLRTNENDQDGGGHGAMDGRHGHGRGGESKKTDFELYKHGVSVNIEGVTDESGGGSGGSSAITTGGPKEVPIWMRASTVSTTATNQNQTSSNQTTTGDVPEDHVASFTLGAQPIVSFGESPPHTSSSASSMTTTAQTHHDIVQTLLVHETKTEPSTSSSNMAGNSNSNFSTTNPGGLTPLTSETLMKQEAVSSGDEDDDEDEFEEVEEEELFVTVQGKQVSFNELTENPHLISQMTPDEKQHYIKISQQAFETWNG